MLNRTIHFHFFFRHAYIMNECMIRNTSICLTMTTGPNIGHQCSPAYHHLRDTSINIYAHCSITTIYRSAYHLSLSMPTPHTMDSAYLQHMARHAPSTQLAWISKQPPDIVVSVPYRWSNQIPRVFPAGCPPHSPTLWWS